MTHIYLPASRWRPLLAHRYQVQRYWVEEEDDDDDYRQ